MVNISDQYIPGEGLNFVFSQVHNFDAISKPRQEGFNVGEYSLATRRGIDTKRSRQTHPSPASPLGLGIKQRDTPGSIQSGGKFDSIVYGHDSSGFGYNFDGEEVKVFGKDTECYRQVHYSTTPLIFEKTVDDFLGQSYGYGQVVKLIAGQVITDVSFIMSKAVPSPATPVRFELRISKWNDPLNYVQYAYNEVTEADRDGLADSFAEIKFRIPNYVVPSTEEYCFMVVSYDAVYDGISTAGAYRIHKISETDVVSITSPSVAGLNVTDIFQVAEDVIFAFATSGAGAGFAVFDISGNSIPSPDLSLIGSSYSGSYPAPYTRRNTFHNGIYYFGSVSSGAAMAVNVSTNSLEWVANSVPMPGLYGVIRMTYNDSADSRTFMFTQAGVFAIDPGNFGHSAIPWLPNYSSFTGSYIGVKSFNTGSAFNPCIFVCFGSGNRSYYTARADAGGEQGAPISLPEVIIDAARTPFVIKAHWGLSNTGLYGIDQATDFLAVPGTQTYYPAPGYVSGSLSSVEYINGLLRIKTTGGQYVTFNPSTQTWGSAPFNGGLNSGFIGTDNGIVSFDGSQIRVDAFGNKYQDGFAVRYDGSGMITPIVSDDLAFRICYTQALVYDGNNHDPYNLSVNYLGGGIYPKSYSIFTVLSYDPFTRELTLTAGSLGVDYINKYCYFVSGEKSFGVWSEVDDVPSPNVVVLATPLPAGTGLPGDRIVFYNRIEPQYLYPQLRDSNAGPNKSKLFGRTRSGQNNFWKLQYRQLEYYDNRIFGLTQDASRVIAMDQKFIERLGVNGGVILSVDFGKDVALSIKNFGNFLITFFKEKMGVIKKRITSQDLGLYIYEHYDIFEVGVFSKYSYGSDGTSLYVFGSDNRFRSMGVNDTNLGVRAQGEDIGQPVQNYLDKIKGGDVRVHFEDAEIHLYWRKPGGKEAFVARYSTIRKARFTDSYQWGGDFANMFKSIGPGLYVSVGNTIGIRAGLWDLDEGLKTKGIETSLKMYGPSQTKNVIHTLNKIKLWLGFDGLPIGGKVRVFGGAYEARKMYFDIDMNIVVNNINQECLQMGTTGSSMSSQNTFGNLIDLKDIGVSDVNKLVFVDRELLMRKYCEFLSLSLDISQHFCYYTIEIIGDPGKKLIVSGVSTFYNTANEMAVVRQGILPQDREKFEDFR